LVEERAIRVGATSLATRAWLRNDGPCVVLVHGLGSNLETWGSLVPRLRDWCTVVAFDRRGHGRSSDAVSYTATELAADIAAVVNAYSVVDPVLIGHSTGVWDCLTYATRGSVRVVVCLDQAIASNDPVWTKSLVVQELPEDTGYTDTEFAAEMARGERELGERAWQETYGPMNRRAVFRRSDGLLYYRPSSLSRRDIQAGWASFIAKGEPYDDIACQTFVVLAQRNTGPIHDALKRVVIRHNLESRGSDSDHDIHVEQPQLVADLVREIVRNESS
jgi:pimeloyl-ACP methyl ester carboxylesterase